MNFLGLWRRDARGLNTGFANLLRADDRAVSPHNGLQLQEAEVQFFADVDPYFTANALFSIAPADKAGEFAIDPEEVFLETTQLPAVTIKAGKFKAAAGKHNTLHTHAYPFLDAPLINQDLFGDEGINEAGLSASALIPASWFLELTAQAIGTNNNAFFGSPRAGDVAGVGYLKNLVDLSEDLTLEVGPFALSGSNQWGGSSSAFGSDLIFKWRPSVGGKYRALTLGNEYIQGHRANDPEGEKLGGSAHWIQYQLAERWWIQGRIEFEGIPKLDSQPKRQRQSGLLAFYPTEFSGFRLQYDHLTTDGYRDDHAVALQWSATLGAHPAHTY